MEHPNNPANKHGGAATETIAHDADVDIDSTAKDSRWVQVGRVARAHGIRGELRVVLFNQDSSILFDVETVLIRPRSDGRPSHLDHEFTVAIAKARPAVAGVVLLALECITDRTQAEQLHGAGVFVERHNLPEEQDGEFYIHDILGANVIDENGAEVGRVIDYVSYPTADVLVVQGQARFEIPVVEDFVKNVDTDKRTIFVHDVKDFEVT